jgi:hypothetical protein
MNDNVSPEKDDMNCPIRTSKSRTYDLSGAEFPRIISEVLRGEDALGGPACAERELACVWSTGDGCACRACIPEPVVASAWARELDASAEYENRFFHFIWEGGVWLAYGLADGSVRGVHCPSHNGERAARTRTAMTSPNAGYGVGEVVYELPLAA